MMENKSITEGALICRKCGAPLTADKKFCDQCGKKITNYNNNPALKAAIIALSSVCALSVAINIGGAFKLSALDSSFQSQAKNLSIAEQNLSVVTQSRDRMQAFLEKNVAIIPDDSNGTYHKYTCDYLDLQNIGFFVYSPNHARQVLRNKACPACYTSQEVNEHNGNDRESFF